MTSTQPTALFLFAHQDDEFGIFQKIIDEQRKGRRVLCAYLTTGAIEGQSPLRRNLESLAMLGRLGISDESIFFAGQTLAIPDGNLPDHLASAAEWISNWISGCPEVSSIYIPAWEGGHHDHDALHAMSVVVAKKAGLMKAVRQFPLYNGYKCAGPMFRVLLPLPMNGNIETVKIPFANRIRFVCYCLCYPSQLTTWLGLFPFIFLHYIFYGSYTLQPVSIERITCRPHEGSLYYERRKFCTWEKMNINLTIFLSMQA
jgi:hypothetical protein